MTSIRPAGAEDAAILSRLGALTFVETFGHLYARKDLDAFLQEKHSVESYEAVLKDADCGVWLAEADDGAAIGYAVAAPCSLPAPDLSPRAGELSRIYLAQGAQGGGVGRRLLETALDFLKGRYDHIYLSVYAENVGAQRLYERYGFIKVHEHFFKVGDHLDQDWIMQLKKA